jgi:hypothetical protein
VAHAARRPLHNGHYANWGRARCARGSVSACSWGAPPAPLCRVERWQTSCASACALRNAHALLRAHPSMRRPSDVNGPTWRPAPGWSTCDRHLRRALRRPSPTEIESSRHPSIRTLRELAAASSVHLGVRLVTTLPSAGRYPGEPIGSPSGPGCARSRRGEARISKSMRVICRSAVPLVAAVAFGFPGQLTGARASVLRDAW